MLRGIVGKQFKFDSAHWLQGYKGKCSFIHGHTWTIDVEIEGPIDRETGMVLDFVILQEIMDKILEKVDHKLLNYIVNNPTCEMLVQFFWGAISYELGRKFPNTNIDDKNLYPQVCGIKIQEGTGGYSKWIPD